MNARKLTIRGVAIQVEDHGGEGEVVLFIHHGGSNLRMWDPVIPFFRAAYRCIAIDLRGHGQSDAPATGYHIDDMACDVAGVLVALDVERAHVVGSSIGAEVGLSLAAQFPTRTRSLVAEGALSSEYGPYGTRDAESFEQDEALRSRLAESRGTLERTYESREALMAEKSAFYKNNGLWNPAVEASLAYGIVEDDAGHFRDAWRKHARDAYMESYFNCRFEDYYAQITCPILMLPDAEDAADEKLFDIMTRLCHLAEACEIVRVPGAMHPFGWILDPAPMAQAVLGFFNRLS